MNTVTGRNIAFVLQATGYDEVEEINVSEVKKRIKFCDMAEENNWKVDFLREIVNVKNNVLVLDDEGEVFFDNEDLNDIIDYLSTC